MTLTASSFSTKEFNTLLSAMTNRDVELKAFCSEVHDDDLLALAKYANAKYRDNNPIMSDQEYDTIVLKEIALRDPEHPYLNTVEEESEDSSIDGKLATLPARMLSTNKSYSRKEIDAWISRIQKAAAEINFPLDMIELRITAKLDGFASYDDGKTMYTRGNGIRGTDIGYVLKNGIQRLNDAERGLGAGEIVVDPIYFEENLSGHFENTRNVISGVLRESPISLVKKAIEEKGVVFAPFSSLEDTVCSIGHFNLNYDSIIQTAKESVLFDIDGVIIEVTNREIKAHMGATQKAHRWMIALKENEAPVSINVLSVLPQTSRKGRVVPVLLLEPTKVSGVTVSRVTGHNYANIKAKGISKGAVIGLVRSGLVIPKITHVVSSTEAEIPHECPSCKKELEWGNEDDGTKMDLVCNNIASCPAQSLKRLQHWFITLENVDGFGPSTIQKLIESGITSIPDIYKMSVEQYINCGFGEKTANNLVSEIKRSRTEAVEDYRFLAAFGIRTLGKSMSENILAHYKLSDLFSVSKDDLIKINKIGEVKARCIYNGLAGIKERFDILANELKFNLIPTPLASESEDIVSPISGKIVVFTGTMHIHSRKEMEKAAKGLGATIGKSVSSKTDILIAGDKVGASKINAAEKHGTQVLSEDDYYKLLKSAK
jgi:DNA ligase (NAD+)